MLRFNINIEDQHRSSHSTRPGYTYIELIWTMLIIGIVSAGAVSRWGVSVQRYRADAAARRIAQDIQLTQASARKSGTNQMIIFDLVAEAYRVSGQLSLERRSGTYGVNLTDDPYDSVITSAVFNNNGTSDSEDQTLVFDRFGIPDSGGSVVVNAGGISRTITVNAFTGQVTLP
jgi:type II secretory pathway pseudopilin PulG